MCILWLMGSTNVPWNEFYKALPPPHPLLVIGEPHMCGHLIKSWSISEQSCDFCPQALRPTMCLFVCLSLLKLSVAVFSSSLPLFSHGTLWYWKVGVPSA